jgi:hypothetical protein
MIYDLPLTLLRSHHRAYVLTAAFGAELMQGMQGMFHSEIFQTFLHRGHLKNSHDAREIAPSQMAKLSQLLKIKYLEKVKTPKAKLVQRKILYL